jgi:serine/threonine protein kinase
VGLCPACGRLASGFAFCPDDGAALVSDDEHAEPTAPLPRQLDRYRLVRKIGQGGTSDVFEAEHVHIGKRVALKLLRRQLAGDERAVERLRREARTASSVGHPNIVQIEDFGVTSDGVVYLAMEWLEGETLAQRIEHGPIRQEAAVDVALQIAAGLGAAHAAGVIHRDMKPANVFLARQPDGSERVKLLDFGIAKLAMSETRLTRTGTFIGTPDYVAPEQALGEELDGRADLYSLGVVLYQLVTGTLPFTGPSFMTVLHRHATEPPEPPTRRAPQRALSSALEAVVLRCMAKRPEDRFASAEELSSALEAARRSRPSAVLPLPQALSGPGYDEGPRPTAESPVVRAPSETPAEDAPRAMALPWAGESDESTSLPRSGRGAMWLLLLVVAGGAAVGAALIAAGDAPVASASDPIDAGAALAIAPPDAAAAPAPLPAPDAAPPAPPARVSPRGVWRLRGRAPGFDYTVSIDPGRVRPGRRFHFQVAIRPGAELARSWRRGAVRAQVSFHHAASRRIELRGEFPLDGDRLSAELSLPRAGTHQVALVLHLGEAELGRARFDVCVGADPSGPPDALARVCPAAQPGALTPRSRP